MIKMVIWDQSKSLSLILKIEQSKIQKSKICILQFIIDENGNKTSIQLILESNSTSFMFYSIFSEIKGKKVIH